MPALPISCGTQEFSDSWCSCTQVELSSSSQLASSETARSDPDNSPHLANSANAPPYPAAENSNQSREIAGALLPAPAIVHRNDSSPVFDSTQGSYDSLEGAPVFQSELGRHASQAQESVGLERTGAKEVEMQLPGKVQDFVPVAEVITRTKHAQVQPAACTSNDAEVPRG